MSNDVASQNDSDPALCPDCGKPLLDEQAERVCPACLATMFFGGEDAEPLSMDEPVRSSGDVIGRYRLIEPIGEGGFGIVYRAEQSHPLQRQVALKLIKPGLDSRSVVARFEAERQALSMLDHPNIARVLDAGTTSDGRPFFVMELVNGRSVTQYCDRHQLSLEERLTLFLDLCSGMEHAHAKGVIHRDVKPSNVMVAAAKDDLPPKLTIIDFGIAKALWQELTPHTLFTHPRQMMGTPEYMSPEQALNGGLDIDTRADVYSLGAVLYELLTGHPPLSDASQPANGIDHWIRTIREVVPMRPSRRLARSDSQVQPSPLLNRRLENELDWVVLKALDKDRDRRYQTVRELGEDIRRFLNHEAVSARPPSLSYLTRKFIRRHRAQVALAALALGLLIGGSIVSLWLALRAEAAEEKTRQAFSQADVAVAHEKAQSQRYGEAVALLCRSLRLDGNNQEAAFRLLTLLSEAPIGIMAAPALHHPEPIRHGRFLPPDGRQILTASNENGTLTIWDWQAAIPKKVRTLGTPESSSPFAISADGRYAATSAKSPTQSEIAVWSIQDGSLQGRPLLVSETSPPSSVLALALSPQGDALYAATSDHKIIAWNLLQSTVLWKVSCNSTPHSLEVSSDGRRLAAGIDARLALFDTATGFTIHDSIIQRHRVEGIKFTPDGKKVMLTGGDVFSATVDSETGQKHGDLQHFDRIRALDISSDSERVATGGVDGYVRLRTVKGAFIHAERLPDAVRTLCFSGNGQKLAASTLEPHATIALLKGHSGEPISAPLQLHRTVTDLSFHPDNHHLLVTNQSEQALIFDTRPRHLTLQTLSVEQPLLHAGFLPAGGVYALTESGDLVRRDLQSTSTVPPLTFEGQPTAFDFQETIGVVATKRSLWQVDLASWKLVQRMPLSQSIDRLRIASKSHHLLIADSSAGQIQLYPPHATQASFAWQSDLGPITAFTLSDDGKVIVTGHENGTLVFHNVETGVSRRVQNRNPTAILSQTFNHDATRLITGSFDAQLCLWDVATATEVPSALASPPKHADSAMPEGLRTLYSPSAELFFSYNSRDHRVRSFTPQGGLPSGPVLSHSSGVQRLAQSPDGSLLLTAEESGLLSLWHLASRLPAAAPRILAGDLIHLAFSSDGQLAMAATRQGQLHLWHLPPSAPAPLPEAFLRFAEGFGRWRFTTGNVVTDVPYDILQEAREEVLALPGAATNPQLRWLKWLAADPETRPPWPWAP